MGNRLQLVDTPGRQTAMLATPHHSSLTLSETHGAMGRPMVHLHSDKDRGWTMEIAYPLNAFEARQHVPPPVNGTQWRLNFSCVKWKAGQPREDNWVWSPQGLIDMHVPEHWGYLNFRK